MTQLAVAAIAAYSSSVAAAAASAIHDRMLRANLCTRITHAGKAPSICVLCSCCYYKHVVHLLAMHSSRYMGLYCSTPFQLQAGHCSIFQHVFTTTALMFGVHALPYTAANSTGPPADPAATAMAAMAGASFSAAAAAAAAAPAPAPAAPAIRWRLLIQLQMHSCNAL